MEVSRIIISLRPVLSFGRRDVAILVGYLGSDSLADKHDDSAVYDWRLSTSQFPWLDVSCAKGVRGNCDIKSCPLSCLLILWKFFFCGHNLCNSRRSFFSHSFVSFGNRCQDSCPLSSYSTIQSLSPAKGILNSSNDGEGSVLHTNHAM